MGLLFEADEEEEEGEGSFLFTYSNLISSANPIWRALMMARVPLVGLVCAPAWAQCGRKQRQDESEKIENSSLFSAALLGRHHWNKINY